MASSSSTSTSTTTKDLKLPIYDGRPRYTVELGKGESTLNYPLPIGTTKHDIDLNYSGTSIRCSLKKSADDSAILEGKLWAPLQTAPMVSFETDKGFELQLNFIHASSSDQWPVIIRAPRTADETSIDPYSAYKLAVLYAEGHGSVSAQPKEALGLLQNAALHGVAEAQFRLGQIHSDPKLSAVYNAPYDPRLALSYFLAVADVTAIGANSDLTFAQVGEAQFRMGEAYENGVGGIAPHLETALKWYRRAHLNGDVNSRLKLEHHEKCDSDDESDSASKSSSLPKSSASAKKPTPKGSASPKSSHHHHHPKQDTSIYWNIALGIGLVGLCVGLVYEKLRKN